MPRAPLSDQQLLEISLRCGDVLAREGADASTAALVEASGLSERTFFRYFPTKADSLRPLLEAGYHRFVRDFSTGAIRAGEGVALIDIAVTAFASAYAGHQPSPDDALTRLLVESPAYRRVWLEINEDTASALRAPTAAALGIAEDSIDARIAADEATLLAVSAMRLMAQDAISAADAAALVADSMRHHPLARGITRAHLGKDS